MAAGFECDLCKRLQAGLPLVKHEIKIAEPGEPSRTLSEEWCTACLSSFQDWRASRDTQEAVGE